MHARPQKGALAISEEWHRALKLLGLVEGDVERNKRHYMHTTITDIATAAATTTSPKAKGVKVNFRKLLLLLLLPPLLRLRVLK